MSPSFKRLVQTFQWKDSFRQLHPTSEQYSRYYGINRGEGASRIDRCYHYGEINIQSASYLPLAFSDHHAHIVKIILPDPFAKLTCPISDYSFRIKTEVVNDLMFKESLRSAMQGWKNIKSFGLDTLIWWENIVRPGIKKLAKQRGRELIRQMREELNVLRLRQGYLNRKIMQGETWQLTELKTVHLKIDKWYDTESNKIKYQSQANEYNTEEKDRVYHHDLHRKRMKKIFNS